MDPQEARELVERLFAPQRLPAGVERFMAEGAAVDRFFAEEGARSIARLRARGLLGDVWATYEAEVGPLEAATDQDMRELLEVHAMQATILGGSPLALPRRVAELICRRLLARLTGAPVRRPRGGQSKSWRGRRWEWTAIAQTRARKAQLVAEGYGAEEAWELAVEDVAWTTGDGVLAFGVQPATLASWAKNPGRRRRK